MTEKIEIVPPDTRYSHMPYRNAGLSGLKISALSLGLWQNFGEEIPFDKVKQMILTAFNLGITHFDCANNYGIPSGSAEQNFGKVLKKELLNYRNEIIISTKAGYTAWPGVYGDWGSKKYLTASIDRSLQRLNIDYIDIFYHHRPDPNTPLIETLLTLDGFIKQGKALYIGLSKYPADQLRQAIVFFRQQNTPFILFQPKYSLLERSIEQNGIIDLSDELGFGIIPFSPLAQGLLSDKYFSGIPNDSRANNSNYLHPENVSVELISVLKQLNEVALLRKQTLAQMSLAWCLRLKQISSLIIGASKSQQIIENSRALDNLEFSKDELEQIDSILESIIKVT